MTGCEPLFGIERHVLEQELVVGHRLRIEDANGVAVGRRLGAGARAEVLHAAGPVFDDDRLSPALVQLVASARMKMSLMPPALVVVSALIGRVG